MRTKLSLIVILVCLTSFILLPAASAKECCGEPWHWAKVKYTQLDFKAMEFLWSSWVLPESGKIAILPFTDYSDESIISTPYGGSNTYAARRVAESLAYEFTRLGLKPLPYDDCLAAVDKLVAARDKSNPSEAMFNNGYFLENKSEDMIAAVKDSAPGVFSSMKSTSEGAPLSIDDIKAIGGTVGADLVIRGSLSEYGMQSKHEANWRTFIPPFLGMFNPEKEGMIEATVYMYDAHTGELVWVVYEEIEVDPTLPYFKTNFEVMDSAEALMALKVVSHLVMPPPPCEKEKVALTGEGMCEEGYEQ